MARQALAGTRDHPTAGAARDDTPPRRWARDRRSGAAAVTTVLAVVVLIGGPGGPVPSAGAAPPRAPSTVTWAEPVGTPPDYIFPFMGVPYFNVDNAEEFQYLMYRPLYWFEPGAPPDLDRSLSLADDPVYSKGGSVVTIDLKPYEWSDGESVTAPDVMFWMNMLHAEKANWGAYDPGGGAIPDIVTDVTVDSPTRLTFDLTGRYNQRWFTDDELSQITPLPVAWDKTSAGAPAGSGQCAEGLYGTVDNQCAAVYTFLSEQAGYDPDDPGAPNGMLSTYASNPLWQVVDGPWRLSQFTPSGRATFVPNQHFSGSLKPALRRFVELPFSSDRAEYDALVAGRVDVGYLPPEDVTARTGDPALAAPNTASLGHFTLAPLYTWSIDEFPYNFQSTGDGGNAGPIFRQLYFRQAMQDLVDQPRDIERIAHGYGVGDYGPVPVVPQDHSQPGGTAPNPYPYNPARARSLLAAHGWQVDPGGTSTCGRPGTATDECGAGIAAGAPLAFTLQYANGAPLLRRTVEADRSSWSHAGIAVTLVPASPTTVLDAAVPCPQGCPWEMADSGSGWLFAPDYYPSGEDLFGTGAADNAGDFSDPTNDTNISATTTGQVGLSTYERFLAHQLPVVFQPSYATTLTEVRHGLEGVTPQSETLQLDPEAWRWAR